MFSLLLWSSDFILRLRTGSRNFHPLNSNLRFMVTQKRIVFQTSRNGERSDPSARQAWSTSRCWNDEEGLERSRCAIVDVRSFLTYLTVWHVFLSAESYCTTRTLPVVVVYFFCKESVSVDTNKNGPIWTKNNVSFIKVSWVKICNIKTSQYSHPAGTQTGKLKINSTFSVKLGLYSVV